MSRAASASERGDFWSRRRAGVAAEAEAERAAEAAEARARRQAEAEAKSDDDILAELELPDPDTLAPGDDFAAFLRDEVPERLRRRALRRLWRSNPVLANADGLLDYGGDFTDSATVVENLQTVYRVGRGMIDRLAEAAEAAPTETAAADAPETAIAHTPPEAAEADAAAPDEAASDDEPPAIDSAEAEAAPLPERDAPAPPRRRMRFAFEGEAQLQAQLQAHPQEGHA